MDTENDADGIRIARKIARHEPAKSEIIEEYAPGSTIADDDYDGLLDWARNTATTIYHPTGTCKMGSDPMAVVDPALSVRGLQGLRVVDASVMPTMPSGNINAPVIMVAEKAADLILAG